MFEDSPFQDQLSQIIQQVAMMHGGQPPGSGVSAQPSIAPGAIAPPQLANMFQDVPSSGQAPVQQPPDMSWEGRPQNPNPGQPFMAFQKQGQPWQTHDIPQRAMPPALGMPMGQGGINPPPQAAQLPQAPQVAPPAQAQQWYQKNVNPYARSPEIIGNTARSQQEMLKRDKETYQMQLERVKASSELETRANQLAVHQERAALLHQKLTEAQDPNDAKKITSEYVRVLQAQAQAAKELHNLTSQLTQTSEKTDEGKYVKGKEGIEKLTTARDAKRPSIGQAKPLEDSDRAEYNKLLKMGVPKEKLIEHLKAGGYDTGGL